MCSTALRRHGGTGRVLGTVAQHLTGVFDINQAAQGSGGDINHQTVLQGKLAVRNYAVVNEVKSNLNRITVPLQASLRVQNCVG